jgi:hypothetical protein
MGRLELPDGLQPGGYCVPLEENMYDLFKDYKTIAQQIVEDDIAEGLPHAVRGGIKFTCGTAASALAKMEEKDASA